MPKLFSLLTVLLPVLCGAARGQGRRQRAETGRRAEPAPLVILDSTKGVDGLKGPVRRIETEVFKVWVERGVLTEKARALLGRTVYDERGRRVENETYPVVGGRAGRATTTRPAIFIGNF